MFFGQYNHSLDEKSRVRVPSRFKTELGSKFVITKGTSKCLFVFSDGYFENQFLSKLSQVPTFDSAGQKAIRTLLSSSFDIEEDNQGRCVLPAGLKEYANIKKEIVFVGVGNRIEIWAKEQWEDYNANDDFDTIAQKLSEFSV